MEKQKQTDQIAEEQIEQKIDRTKFPDHPTVPNAYKAYVQDINKTQKHYNAILYCPAIDLEVNIPVATIDGKKIIQQNLTDYINSIKNIKKLPQHNPIPVRKKETYFKNGTLQLKDKYKKQNFEQLNQIPLEVVSKSTVEKHKRNNNSKNINHNRTEKTKYILQTIAIATVSFLIANIIVNILPFVNPTYIMPVSIVIVLTAIIRQIFSNTF